MRGLQLTADLTGCATTHAVMRDPTALRMLCLGAVRDAGLTAVADVFHGFSSGDGNGTRDHDAAGITVVVLLAESHLAVHTWPELGSATLDVYVCNRGRDNGGRAEALLAALVAAFAPSAVVRQSLARG